MRFFQSFAQIWKIPDLRTRVLFTLGMLLVYRLGGLIPIPGIDFIALRQAASGSSNDLFNMYNMFVGGAFSRAAIFAQGIMPYISASIIMQLMGTIIPTIGKLQKEGQEGRNKISQYTRYLTVVIAAVQAAGVSVYLYSLTGIDGQPVVLEMFREGAGKFMFTSMTILTLTTGTMFVMYLGEQITARGIGNGTSLIIFIGIVAQLPQHILNEGKLVLSGEHDVVKAILIAGIVFAIIAFIVLVDQGLRRIPLQNPRRMVGRKLMGGAASYLPLKVNTAGVIPVIFASSIMFIPSTMATFLPNIQSVQEIAQYFLPGHWLYAVSFSALIIFFAFFYTAVQYNPTDIADNLKKSGGFIPGIRPGKKTAEYIDYVLTRITLPGAIFLSIISVGPYYIKDSLGTSFYLGGTSVLICVGVALETLRQFESHLRTRHYEGFLEKGRIRGRRGY
ncbi:MAG: preprotein translocase subunit SecY [Fibrobacterota bacterium]|nr:preprotein translocase subunit SecY [Fibrobacterota bacterium]QQS06873.1 MAG: preprotein translocase subunit SecY [Fibrobacterota bacterium]